MDQVKILKLPGKKAGSLGSIPIYYGFEFSESPNLGEKLTGYNRKAQLDASKAEIDAVNQQIYNALGNGRYSEEGPRYQELLRSPTIQGFLKRQKDLMAQHQDLLSNRPILNKKYQLQQYLALVRRAWSRIIKSPIKDSEEEEMQIEFTEEAVKRYQAFRPDADYDYVLYPESSSDLAQSLAKSLAAAYGAQALQGFEKMSQGQMTQPHIDPESWEAANPGQPMPAQERIDMGWQKKKGEEGGIKKFYIKNVDQWIRPHLNYMQKIDYPGISYQGKNILLVDDNVASGGTFQGLYRILKKEGVGHVDIYVPLLYNIHTH